MRRLFLALALLTTACTSLGPDQPLRVMTYNIHAGKDAGGVDNLERVAAIIRSTKADFVLLQEVDRGTTRSGNVDQLGRLMQLTGMHGAFGKSLDYQGGQYGIATLSRWPISQQETIHLAVEPPQERAGGSHEPRVALFVAIAAPKGPITIANTHLDASREDHYRLQEVSRLLEAAGERSPTIIGGDLNAEPKSAVHEKLWRAGLQDAWTGCAREDGLTYPAARPVKRIDYVFLSRRARCTSAEVLETEASDHRPVLVRAVDSGRRGRPGRRGLRGHGGRAE